jgi:glycosyltransferase involved in cell wall biosynthesis
MSAHILIIADGRSPTAQRWIANTQALGYDVSLVSTFPCSPPDGVHHFFILPVAFSRLGTSMQAGTSPAASPSQISTSKKFIRRFAPLLQSLRYVLGPLTILRFAFVYQKLVHELQPDLVHALRIPFEGMLGSYTPRGIPFVVATWGNDLTLHASGSILMRLFTKRCLVRANGFTADTHRDVRLAYAWGLPKNAPTLVVPGSGGLDLEAILSTPASDLADLGLPATGHRVVNLRGLRPKSVHQDVFFAAIPEILVHHPDTHFICPGLAGNTQAESWVDKYGIRKNIHLLPKLAQPQLWSLLKSAQLFVSPSSHDGTPNSLLEAMACGCFPVAGNIESLREWIEDGINGLLVDPRDPHKLAEAVCHALDSDEKRQKAAEHNLALVRQRASQDTTHPLIDTFYQQFIK